MFLQNPVHRLQGFLVAVLRPSAGDAQINGDLLPLLEEQMALFKDQTEVHILHEINDFPDIALGIDQGVNPGVQDLLLFHNFGDGLLHGGDITSMGNRLGRRKGIPQRC